MRGILAYNRQEGTHGTPRYEGREIFLDKPNEFIIYCRCSVLSRYPKRESIMARRIEPTPIVTGKDAEVFLQDMRMNEPVSVIVCVGLSL